jgi:hypothetical protein
MLDGEFGAVPTWEHATSESGAGYLPTVVASEYKGVSRKRHSQNEHCKRSKMAEGLRRSASDGIYLNPLFAEIAMAWPAKWSALDQLEMDKIQEWRQQHSAFFRKECYDGMG